MSIMKKVLLTGAAVVAFNNVAVAEMGFAEDWYGGVDVGGSYLPKISKYKSANDFLAGARVGTYLMDNVRVELEYDHHFSPQMKTKATAANVILGNALTVPNTVASPYTVSSKNKLQLDTLMLNAKVDIYNFSMAEIFVGGGLGWSRIQNKMTATTVAGTVPTPAPVAGVNAAGDSKSYKVKAKNSFAVAGYVGFATEFTEGVFGDLTFSAKYHGKTNFLGDAPATLASLTGVTAPAAGTTAAVPGILDTMNTTKKSKAIVTYNMKAGVRICF